MKTALATLAALLTMALALAAWGEPHDMTAPPPPRVTRVDECVWSFSDAVTLRDDLMPGHRNVTLETRTRLCYHGATYSIATFQRYTADGESTIIVPWKSVGEIIRLLTRPGDPPAWGDDVFKIWEAPL